jgi:hypothetical protein
MSDMRSSSPTTPTSSGAGDEGRRYSSASDAARDQASGLGQNVKDSGKHVAGVTKDEAKHVAAEAGQQAKDLLNQTRHELGEQAATQQKRVAEGLLSLSSELGSMAAKSEEDGLAADLARQASRQLGEVGHWLDSREPGAVVGEVKRFARSRPGTFLAVAAGIGLAAGRLTRGLAADASQGSTDERDLPVPVAPRPPSPGAVDEDLPPTQAMSTPPTVGEHPTSAGPPVTSGLPEEGRP